MIKKLIKHGLVFGLVAGLAVLAVNGSNVAAIAAGVILVLGVVELYKDIIALVDAILAMPEKGFAKVKAYFKNRSKIVEAKKLDKALMQAKYEADLNAARQNPNFRNHPKVKVILDKRAYKASKKAK